MISAPITALVPWYGSKRTMAPKIVEVLGKHKGYLEPMAGSMAVLFAKPRAALEMVNDLHGDLINLARVVASARWVELVKMAEQTLTCAAFCHEFKTALDATPATVAPSVLEVDNCHLERAWQYLTVSWLARNGISGLATTESSPARRWTVNGSSTGSRWTGVAQSIPDWHERLRGVLIDSLDAFSILEKVDDSPEWTIYLDPPYFRKGATYLHDFNPSDHSRLAEALKRFRKTRVVISYYDEPEIRQLYGGWWFHECPMNKNLASQSRRDAAAKVTAPEILIVNQPAKPAGLFD